VMSDRGVLFSQRSSPTIRLPHSARNQPEATRVTTAWWTCPWESSGDGRETGAAWVTALTGVCQQLDLRPSSSAAVEEKRQPGSIAALTVVPADPAGSRQSSLALVLQAPVPPTWIVVLFRPTSSRLFLEYGACAVERSKEDRLQQQGLPGAGMLGCVHSKRWRDEAWDRGAGCSGASSGGVSREDHDGEKEIAWGRIPRVMPGPFLLPPLPSRPGDWHR
jgi:hypothetical protein